MLSQHGAVAAYAFVLASCALLITSSPATSDVARPATPTGLFISYDVDQKGGSITIQQNEKLTVYSLVPSVTIRERADEGEWQTTSLPNIAQGEPVSLQLDGAGLVRQVDAEYDTVTTRLITQKNGSLVTTSGRAYKLVGRAAQLQSTLNLGTFLKLRVDSRNETAFDVTASTKPFTGGSAGEQITVTIVVSVPLNTPSKDIVYIASDAANWVPNGLRMAPLSGNRWSATFALGKGSTLKYKYTRGSWGTAESNRSGIEIPNRSLNVAKTGETQQFEDVVVRWADLSS